MSSEKKKTVLPVILTIGLRVDDIDSCVVLDDIDYFVFEDHTKLFTMHNNNFSLVEKKLLDFVLESRTSVTVPGIFDLEFKQDLLNKLKFQLKQFGLELKTYAVDKKKKSMEFQNRTTTTDIGKMNTFWYLPPLFKNKLGMLWTAEGDWFLCQLIHKYEKKLPFSLLEKLLSARPYVIIEKQPEASSTSSYNNQLQGEKQIQAGVSFFESQHRVKADFDENEKRIQAYFYENYFYESQHRVKADFDEKEKRLQAYIYESQHRIKADFDEREKRLQTYFYESKHRVKADIDESEKRLQAYFYESQQRVYAPLYESKKRAQTFSQNESTNQGQGGVCLQTVVESVRSNYVFVRNYLGRMFQDVAKIKAE